MGKTAFALGHGGPRRDQAEQAGAAVLAGDEPHGADPAPARAPRPGSTPTGCGPASSARRDWPKIGNAISRMSEAPIYIDDNPNLTVMDIRARARRLKSREGLGLVVVDYLQLMTGRHGAENRQVEVSEISRGLKILARELEVPVVALSQLSRGLEMRQDKRPMLADLRESGSIEQDCRRGAVHLPGRDLQPRVHREPGDGGDHRGQAPQRADRARPGWPSSATTPGSTTWPGCEGLATSTLATST